MSRFAHRETLPPFPTMIFGTPVPEGLDRLAAAARSRLEGAGPRRQTAPALHRDPAFAGLVDRLGPAAQRAVGELGYLKALRPQFSAPLDLLQRDAAGARARVLPPLAWQQWGAG
jgi:hypothetical protein